MRIFYWRYVAVFAASSLVAADYAITFNATTVARLHNTATLFVALCPLKPCLIAPLLLLHIISLFVKFHSLPAIFPQSHLVVISSSAQFASNYLKAERRLSVFKLVF